ncbi:MAG: LPS assembly lipoprotein LptE [Methylococcales bacterium]|nr:LPS assembly lipoprotein LptE [Methylococcales bacterium]
MRLFRPVLMLLTLFYLASCGYHLRGEIELPSGLTGIYLKDASPELRGAFGQALSGANTRIVDQPEQAGLVLAVLSERMNRRVLTLTNTGKATEFELRYELEYQVTDAQGKVLLDTQTLALTRDYFNDQLAIIAKSGEEQVIARELYQRAVQQIISRAQAKMSGN